MIRVRLGAMIFVLCVAAAACTATTSAVSFNSTNFKINGSIGDSIAGQQNSTNYSMTSSGGQSVIGSGESGSYKLGEGYTSQLEHSLQLNVQAAGLIGYFPFNQTSGKMAVDDSANSHPANFVGTPTWTTGKLGGGLTGFTSANYLDTTESATYDVTSLTACAWANLTSTSTNPIVVSRSKAAPDANGMWSMGYDTGTTPKLRMYFGGSTITLTHTTTVGTGTWNQFCFTYSGGDLIFYVNGVESDRATINQPMASYNYPLKMGAIGSGSQPFDGVIDALKLYSRVLSSKEIAAEYTAQNSGLTAGLAVGDVISGVSQTAGFDSIVQTDAPGYMLGISQNNNLTSGGNTIPAVPGSIASPVTWLQGTTKGLGFTIFGTNATGIPGSWNSGNGYAALPGSDTVFYTRTGLSGGVKDVHNMRLRLDVASTQPTGTYTNHMTLTGTMTP